MTKIGAISRWLAVVFTLFFILTFRPADAGAQLPLDPNEGDVIVRFFKEITQFYNECVPSDEEAAARGSDVKVYRDAWGQQPYRMVTSTGMLKFLKPAQLSGALRNGKVLLEIPSTGGQFNFGERVPNPGSVSGVHKFSPRKDYLNDPSKCGPWLATLLASTVFQLLSKLEPPGLPPPPPSMCLKLPPIVEPAVTTGVVVNAPGRRYSTGGIPGWPDLQIAPPSAKDAGIGTVILVGTAVLLRRIPVVRLMELIYASPGMQRWMKGNLGEPEYDSQVVEPEDDEIALEAGEYNIYLNRRGELYACPKS